MNYENYRALMKMNYKNYRALMKMNYEFTFHEGEL